MPAALRPLLAAVVLAGPTALAFFSGGFFDQPRLVAAVVAWVLVGLTALVAEHPLPRGRSGRVALAALALLTAWTGLSLLWTPLSEPATDDLQRDLLYLGALVVSIALLGGGLARAVEPALAAGALVVIGYGLAGRLLPGVVELSSSETALGRLEQPLTYWNAMGALAAIGLALCTRLAGDPERPSWLRAAALAAGVPLSAGVYLSFSRGALLAAFLGLLALVLIARDRRQLRASVAALALGVLAAIAVGVFPAVTTLEGSDSTRQSEGAVALVLLLALAGLAAAIGAWLVRAESSAGGRRFRRPAVGAPVVLAVAALVLGALGTAAYLENRAGGEAASGATTERLRSLQSRRFDYWEVAARSALDQPLQGVGAGGFRVEWMRERPLPEPADDVHSLPLETLTELGLVGLALLTVLALAVVSAARAVPPPLAAGAGAGLVAWAAHASIDWDWEMPALTLVAIALAGMLLAAADAEPSRL